MSNWINSCWEVLKNFCFSLSGRIFLFLTACIIAVVPRRFQFVLITVSLLLSYDMLPGFILNRRKNKYLKGLTKNEEKLLGTFIKAETKTLILNTRITEPNNRITRGVIRGLEDAGLLYHANDEINLNDSAYNMDSWTYEKLLKIKKSQKQTN